MQNGANYRGYDPVRLGVTGPCVVSSPTVSSLLTPPSPLCRSIRGLRTRLGSHVTKVTKVNRVDPSRTAPLRFERKGRWWFILIHSSRR